MTIETSVLTAEDVEELAPLFDDYRKFYEQTSDIHRARQFLQERFANGDSSIIGAFRRLVDWIHAALSDVFGGSTAAQMDTE